MTDGTPSQFLTTPALIVVGLLVHQAGRLCEYGISEVHRNYAPVFAITLPRWATAVCQTVALPAALIAVVTTPAPTGLLLGIGLVLVWIASIQRRLANHVWLGTLTLVGLACAPPNRDPVVAHDLLAGLYLSAALFKANKDYLVGERSPGRVITEHYAKRLGLPVPWPLLRWVPAGLIAVELTIGVMLLVPDVAKWGMCLALLMHWVFGITGNFPFSIIAMTLWVTVFSQRAGQVVLPAPHDPAWLAVPLSLILAMAFRWKTGKLLSARFVFKDVLQSVLFGFLVTLAISCLLVGSVWPGGGGTALVHWFVGLVFALNAILLVAGVKLEWSFAMFSSLRPFGRSWLQRGGLQSWPRYYSLTLPERIPEPLVRAIGSEFLYKATRAENVVHESVVHHLEKAAGKWCTTFVPCVVVNNRKTGNMEPGEAGGGQPRPRRTPLLFPAVIPKQLDKLYLG